MTTYNTVDRIDAEGFRHNVGIILMNAQRRVFWGRRAGMEAWQFPQGGIRHGETPAMAMYRELGEEVGLSPEAVEVMACTREWLSYRLPRHLVRRDSRPLCIGQKQLWYVLSLKGDESRVRLDTGEKPEFDAWRWVYYWRPLREVVAFKRAVYRQALRELAPFVLWPADRSTS